MRHPLLLVLIVLASRFAAASPAIDPLAHVDPFIGTGGHGHTYPGATLPFGMVQLSPDTRLTGWDGCSGYHASDDRIFGFSHTHLSGTGIPDYGDILFYPAQGEVLWRNSYGKPVGDGYGSRFRKATERAEAGFYEVSLDDSETRVELTATLRTGVHRYTRTAPGPWHLLLDLAHRDQVLESELTVVSDREIQGFRRSKAWAADQRVYFVARFSQPFHALLAMDDQPSPGLRQASGKSVKAALRFPGTTESLSVQVGISAVDVDGARRNLQAEWANFDFDATRQAAQQAWRRALGRIEIEGGTPAQGTTFYTALYHLMLQPNLFTDVDERYRGLDGKTHRAEGYSQYTVFSLWDTFRAAHPLYVLLEPERTADFVRTFLAQADQGGYLPVWELAGNETMCMIGYHAAPVIADAWIKGIRGFDATQALEAMKRSAHADRLGLADYRRLGYIPGDRESESVSKTLEYAYDDWTIARLAGALGRYQDEDAFDLRAQAWRHLLDPETGFMRPRLNGRFKEPFDPREVDFHYTEGNAWQYSFFVPQAVTDHMAALGGPVPYAAKLDQLFAESSETTGRQQADITGLIGQYAHGNEPSHHMAFLYAFAGQPWKTQARVAQIRSELYRAAPDGLAGNEDCGQMSAWYVMAALGFYSVTPGSEDYVLASPLFPRATLHLPNGRVFSIRVDRQGEGGSYVQSASLNGRPFSRSFLRHAEILAGGELAFVLGPSPNQAWGVGPGRQPLAAGLGPRILPLPSVAAGEARFRGTTRVELASAEPGAVIRYTLDGREPGPDSSVYDQPIEIQQTTRLRFRAEKEGFPPTPPEEAVFRRLPEGVRVVSVSEPHHQYRAFGPETLVDGLRGAPDFRLGDWQGYYGTDLEVVLGFDQERQARRLAVGFLQDQGSWILMPLSVRFETSLDGNRWEPAGEVPNQVDPRAEGAITKDFELALPTPRRLRYLRVHAAAVGMCPAWHRGAGSACYIFADEIVVE